MKNNISAYFFLAASPLSFYVFMKESSPDNYFYLLLTSWFLYMFINQKARLQKTYEKTENLALVILDILVAFTPLIGYAIAFLFQEKSVFLLFTLMIMICSNIFLKIALNKEANTA